MKNVMPLSAMCALALLVGCEQESADTTSTGFDEDRSVLETEDESDLVADTDSDVDRDSPEVLDEQATFSSRSETYVDFSEADADDSGTLSIEEAREAWPDLVIVDTNDDGLVNRSEVERAVPGLDLNDSAQARSGGADQARQQPDQTDEDAPITEEEYTLIVTQLEERDSQSGASATARQQGDRQAGQTGQQGQSSESQTGQNSQSGQQSDDQQASAGQSSRDSRESSARTDTGA